MKKQEFVRFLPLTMMIGLFLTRYGVAQSSMDQTEVYTLGEVVVTGERAGVEAIGTVMEVTAEEIEQRDARTLDEALELLPGLDVRTGAQGIPRINLRGLRTRHVILLLNGVPFNSTYDGQFDPSIIPTENIAKIKVSYGTHSVLYGQGGAWGSHQRHHKERKTGLAWKPFGRGGRKRS